MPFLPEVKASADTIYLLPGITGDSSDMSYIASAIEEKSPDCTVFTWHDSRYIESKSPTSPPRAVSDVVDEIVAEIISKTPDHPIKLAGFSWGGILAAKVAEKLESRGYEVSTCILDTLPPVTLREVFKDEGAFLVKLKMTLLQLLTNLTDLTKLDKMNSITRDNLESFKDSKEDDPVTLKSVHLISTSGLEKEYPLHNVVNAWQRHQKIKFFSNTLIQKAEHKDVVSAELAGKIVLDMLRYFANPKLTIKNVFLGESLPPTLSLLHSVSEEEKSWREIPEAKDTIDPNITITIYKPGDLSSGSKKQP